jgi:hypothetical protein
MTVVAHPPTFTLGEHGATRFHLAWLAVPSRRLTLVRAIGYSIHPWGHVHALFQPVEGSSVSINRSTLVSPIPKPCDYLSRLLVCSPRDLKANILCSPVHDTVFPYRAQGSFGRCAYLYSCIRLSCPPRRACDFRLEALSRLRKHLLFCHPVYGGCGQCTLGDVCLRTRKSIPTHHVLPCVAVLLCCWYQPSGWCSCCQALLLDLRDLIHSGTKLAGSCPCGEASHAFLLRVKRFFLPPAVPCWRQGNTLSSACSGQVKSRQSTVVWCNLMSRR